MAVARNTVYFASVVAIAGLVSFGARGVNAASPLVTGDLVIYYDFDNFTNTVMDGSGNGFNGKVQDATRNTLDGDTGRTSITTTGVISNETVNVKRGTGAIKFSQSLVTGEDPVFVDMDGGVIATNHPEQLPTTAATFAAWVYLNPINTTLGGNSNLNSPASIIQGSSAGHGDPHFHAEGDGKIRFTLRNNSGQNIVNSSTGFASHPYPNQPAIDANPSTPPELWPVQTWFHLAATWDNNAAGNTWNLYYNGQLIRSSVNDPASVSDPVPGPWALHGFNDFFDGLGLGCVYDSGGRRTDGLEDELYVFKRALSAAEVQTLYNIAPPGVAGDYNGNGVVDAADYVLWRNGGPLQNDSTPGVQAADYDVWRAHFGNTSGAGLGAAQVPEPACLTLLLVCLGLVSSRRHR